MTQLALPRLAELCAGYGGLGLALHLAGIDHQLAWYAEHAHEPAAVMAHHHPTVPNLGDLTTITNPPPADIITAGFPCQPVSSAGRRQGVHDDRWIIDDVCRVARLAGAQWLILENVAGLLTANDGDALARVCAAMAREGFSRWEWRTLRAADIGAPHRRKRWFCVANADGQGRPRPLRSSARRRDLPTDHGPRAAPHTDSGQPERRRGARQLASAEGLPRHPDRSGADQGRPTARHRRPAAAHPDVERCSSVGKHRGRQPGDDADGCVRARFGGYASAVLGWEAVSGRIAPPPTVDGRLSPGFVEWMMGLPEGHVTAVDLTRRAMLRVLGNGVVPPQAAHAITDLLKNLTPLAPIAPGAHPILGRPWGHGATAITRVDRNTPCADCARPLRTLDDRLAHLMPDGLTICTPCARTRAAIHHPDLYTQGATP